MVHISEKEEVYLPNQVDVTFDELSPFTKARESLDQTPQDYCTISHDNNNKKICLFAYKLQAN